MSEEEKAAYQSEITRLNKIISLAIEQNDLLKHDISYLKTVIRQNNITLPDTKTGVGLNNEGMSYSKTGVWLPDDRTSYSEIGVGLIIDRTSNSKTGVGHPENGTSYSKTEVGLTTDRTSNSKTGVGQTDDGKSNSKIGVGQTEVLKPLPAILPTEGFLIHNLAHIIKSSGNKYMSRGSRMNAAKLLIHFYNKSPSDYRDLRKVTGLSEGGISKFMTALRKRGLIQNTGWQKYSPTAHALVLMQKAMEGIGLKTNLLA